MEFHRGVGWMGIRPAAGALFCFLLLAAVPWTTEGNSDGDALSAFRQAVLDPLGVLQTWNASDATPCAWLYVTCNAESRVVIVGLGNASLAGPLVPELGNLTELQYLELYANNFTGFIPAELSELENLVSLDLYGNQLTGTIPTALGNLTNLVFLRLNNNILTGDIPASLGNLTMLKSLLLNNNSLTGAIPEELTLLDKLLFLDLSYNFLSGEIPVTGVFAFFGSGSFAGNPGLHYPLASPAPSPGPSPPESGS